MTAPRLLLLDRDDTLIVDVPYLRDPEAVRLLPGAALALRTLSGSGVVLAIVSNQSGVGRGWITPEEAAAVHARVVADFAAEGVRFAGAYYCPHAPEADCACRKPRPGLLERAAQELGLDLASAVMLGDKSSDVEAGRAAGCRALRFAAEDAAVEVRATADVVGWDAAGARIASLLEVEYQRGA